MGKIMLLCKHWDTNPDQDKISKIHKRIMLRIHKFFNKRMCMEPAAPVKDKVGLFYFQKSYNLSPLNFLCCLWRWVFSTS